MAEACSFKARLEITDPGMGCQRLYVMRDTEKGEPRITQHGSRFGMQQISRDFALGLRIRQDADPSPNLRLRTF